MLTVPEAARRIQRNPETIRRWIREGKLEAQRVGTQYLIDEADLPASHALKTREAPAAYVVGRPAQAVDPWLTTIVGRLVREFDPVRIVLIGSRARSDAREDSDYDLFVVLDEVPDKRAARTAIRRALSDLPISKDVVVASVEEAKEGESGWGAFGWVAGEGRPLYERT
jgi:excisionase family DNA binding protein